MTASSHLSNVWFSVTPLQVSHGLGCWVTTTSGEEYLDFAAGIAVNSTGHAHPAVAAAIGAQAQRFIHAQVNVFKHDLLEPLAAKLADLAPGAIDTFFFANSGAEITEASVKLAKQATKRPNTIVFAGSFHGRTHMTMAMTTSKTGYRAGHAPLPSGIFVAPYPDPMADDQDAEVAKALFGFDHLLKSMTAPEETAAVILEPVLGEGGYIPAPAAFIQGIVERCRQHGILFIADEVQSGFGRTGKMFAVEHYGIEPDIICMAKGIASGFPFAALGTRRELDDKWPTGSHGGTYGGNAMGCAAALATIEIMADPAFLENVNARGAQLQAGIRELQQEHSTITDVRGFGLMVGTEFDDAARVSAITKHCLEEGHLILMNAGTYGRTLRWMPPLVVNEREIDLALAAFSAALKATAQMPRLDAERIALWRQFGALSIALQRRLDQELIERHDLPLTWFDALTDIRAAGGSIRVHELCEVLGEVPSSFSRRLDRMEEAGFLRRKHTPQPDDRRAVTVSLTADGRAEWRDANITYRRLVQEHFARKLTETDIAALQRIWSKLDSD